MKEYENSWVIIKNIFSLKREKKTHQKYDQQEHKLKKFEMFSLSM